MSDTEEEASFASADEGDGVDKKAGTVKKSNQPSSGIKQQREMKNLEKAGNGQTDKKDTAVAQSKKDLPKGKDKQQSQTKTTGKGESQTTQKTAGTKSNPTTRKPAKETKISPGAKSLEKPLESQEKLKPEVKHIDATKEDDLPEATTDTPKVTSEKDVEKVDRQSKVSTADRVEVISEAKQDVPKPERVQESDASKNEEVVISGDIRTKLESLSSPGGQDIPRGQRDHTPEQEKVLEKLGGSTEKSTGGGWGWSNWGSSLLTAATNSVQTFTHQVGDGFSTIMDTVESSFGVPNPEEIAKAQDIIEQAPSLEEQPTVTSQPDLGQLEEKAKASEIPEQEKSKTDIENKEGGGDDKQLVEEEKENGKKEAGGGEGWFSGWRVADLAKKVQDTGKSLASKGQTLMSEGFDAVENLAAGGIDVLESIGKKTYNTLSEHDPAFRKTREFLSPKGNKPNLSSVLREAKEKAEYDANLAREDEEARKAHFGTLFDDYQGIAHLEALEMLSNQSEKKVHSLLNILATSDLAKIKPTLISIKEAFEISDEDDDTPKEQDFSSLVSQCVSELELGTAPDKLNKVHEMVKHWIVDFDSHDSHESDNIKDVHQKSIQALAELTAKGVEQFHKAGELVLLERDKDKDCTERAHSLARLTGVLCHEIGNLASIFVEILNKMAAKDGNVDEVTPLVTNVYLEATNSSTYIQDAFQLLLPVLQHAALEHSIVSRQS